MENKISDYKKNILKMVERGIVSASFSYTSHTRYLWKENEYSYGLINYKTMENLKKNLYAYVDSKNIVRLTEKGKQVIGQ